jgi:flagellar hook-basal body complex protein FliE
MSDISVANVMAVRAAILERNAALRHVAPTNFISTPATSSAPGAAQASFASTLQAAVSKASATLEQEDVATESYERGETTDIATVAMIQARASVTFEATLQVRNKLLSAYKDIMSMTV